MPRLAKPLTELEIRKAKPATKAYALADGNGLSLLVSPAGRKTWSVRYRLPDGSRPAPAVIGHYPAMLLAEARIRAAEVQSDAVRGKATAGIRKAQQEVIATEMAEQAAELHTQAETENASFRAVSSRWLAAKHASWAIETYRKARLVVDSYLVPKLGDLDLRMAYLAPACIG